ncbi:hypothetical protein ACA910_018834 [Epithemia clementina (nom. ined.)]
MDSDDLPAILKQSSLTGIPSSLDILKACEVSDLSTTPPQGNQNYSWSLDLDAWLSTDKLVPAVLAANQAIATEKFECSSLCPVPPNLAMALIKYFDWSTDKVQRSPTSVAAFLVATISNTWSRPPHFKLRHSCPHFSADFNQYVPIWDTLRYLGRLSIRNSTQRQSFWILPSSWMKRWIVTTIFFS